MGSKSSFFYNFISGHKCYIPRALDDPHCIIDEAEANEGMRGLKVVKATACAIKPGARYVINVGSIGRPREGSKATYAVFDTGAKKVSLVALTKSNRARRGKGASRKTACQRT